MWEYGLPVLYAVFVWWFSTGAILYLDRLPAWTYRWSMASATVVLALSLHGLAASSAVISPAGAYLAFTYALLIWAWHEIAFLTGFLTGPVNDPCPAHYRGWRRTRQAIGMILYHEIALAVTAVLVVLLTWNAPNPIGALTFLVLWLMRLSTKLNLFLGVPNVMEEFLPDHLDHLKSVFRRKPMNALFPLSVTGSAILLGVFVYAAVAPGAGGDYAAIGYTLLATFVALALLEHWFLVFQLPVIRLWSWGLREKPQPLDMPDPPTKSGAWHLTTAYSTDRRRS